MKSLLYILKDENGESIGETLVALLISAVAIIMLAGAINTAMRVVIESRNKLDTYYSKNDGLAAMSSGGKEGKVTITDGSSDDPLTIPVYDINYYENNDFASTPVISYKKSSS